MAVVVMRMDVAVDHFGGLIHAETKATTRVQGVVREAKVVLREHLAIIHPVSISPRTTVGPRVATFSV